MIKTCSYSSGFIRDLLNPQNYSLNIMITSGLFNKGSKNVQLTITRIDKNYKFNSLEYKKKTNDEGIAKFESIPEGAYLLNLSKGNFSMSTIIIVNKIIVVKYRLPLINLLFKKDLHIDEDEIEKIHWEFREDKVYCWKCERKYDFEKVMRYRCKHCGRMFCQECRLPEAHDCLIRGKSPPKEFREIHSRGNIRIEY